MLIRKSTVQTAKRHIGIQKAAGMMAKAPHNILKPSYDPQASAWLGALNQSDAAVPAGKRKEEHSRTDAQLS